MTTPLQRSLRSLLFSLLLVFSLGLSYGLSDLDKTLRLAQQRYGNAGAQTIRAWQELIESARSLPDLVVLEKVNYFFNRRIQFESDSVIWGQDDYWATPLEFMGRGAGDCEDFSIAKYITLQLMGVKKERLRLIYVRAKTGSNSSVAHMVLGYYAQATDEPLILDNLISSIRTASTRTDLTPVYSFNQDGIWVAGSALSSTDPTSRLSRWRDVLDRMRQDGISP
jgi:predicted transglutaminase-like cysteine proteinase